MYFYDRVFKVKTWVVLDGLEPSLTEEILAQMQADGALLVEWPAHTFKQTLMEFKDRGWAHTFEPDASGNIVLETQLLHLALLAHLKKKNPATMLSGAVTKPVHHINRNVRSDADYERICNELLDTYEPKILSFAFDMGNLCHTGSRIRKVFVSEGPVPSNILGALSDNLLVIRPENLAGVPDDEIYSLIGEKISLTLQQ